MINARLLLNHFTLIATVPLVVMTLGNPARANRYYSTEQGRFVGRDPLRYHEAWNFNLYEYALGRVISYVDPEGFRMVNPRGYPFLPGQLSCASAYWCERAEPPVAFSFASFLSSKPVPMPARAKKAAPIPCYLPDNPEGCSGFCIRADNIGPSGVKVESCKITSVKYVSGGADCRAVAVIPYETVTIPIPFSDAVKLPDFCDLLKDAIESKNKEYPNGWTDDYCSTGCECDDAGAKPKAGRYNISLKDQKVDARDCSFNKWAI